MKIRNKKTGEIFDPVTGTSEKEGEGKSVNKTAVQKERFAQTEERIQKRENIGESILKASERFTEGGGIGKTLAGGKIGLELASIPFRSFESGVSNAALEMQKGNFDPRKIIEAARQGFALEREGQFGDIYKNVGVNPVVADTLGVLGVLSPAIVLKGVNKAFGAISKASDKGLKQAGRSIISAVNEAKDSVGKQVGAEFTKHANHIPVDNIKFLDNVSVLPAVIKRRLKDRFGDFEEFASDLNVGKLREFKTYLGKLRPNDFGKEGKGIAENIATKDLNKGYGLIKEMMWDAVGKSNVPKKVADNLRNLDDAYSTVIKSGRYIKKRVIDSTTGKPSKAGSLSEEIVNSADTTARDALTDIKRASGLARREINKAMQKVESFQKWKSAKDLSSRVTSAVVFGGIAGGIGGKILQSTQDR